MNDPIDRMDKEELKSYIHELEEEIIKMKMELNKLELLSTLNKYTRDD